MKTLTLPEPARRLWLRTRDVLTNLGSPDERWPVHLGGGTVIAAHIRHRKSTDIDVTVRNADRLTLLIQRDDRNLAARLGGEPIRENGSQIKIRFPDGVVDVNTAPVRPAGGAEAVIIDGRVQHVLSITQILRGKFERATNPAPVRDVYDVARLGGDRRFDGELCAAYGMLTDDQQDAIERYWPNLDRYYEQKAERRLVLTEEPCTDMKRLGIGRGGRPERTPDRPGGDRARGGHGHDRAADPERKGVQDPLPGRGRRADAGARRRRGHARPEGGDRRVRRTTDRRVPRRRRERGDLRQRRPEAAGPVHGREQIDETARSPEITPHCGLPPRLLEWSSGPRPEDRVRTEEAPDDDHAKPAADVPLAVRAHHGGRGPRRDAGPGGRAGRGQPTRSRSRATSPPSSSGAVRSAISPTRWPRCR